MKTLIKLATAAAMTMLLASTAQAVSQANQQACSDLKQLQGAISNFKGMSSDATKAQMRDGAKSVIRDAQTFVDSAELAAPKQTNDVVSSLQKLRSDYQNLPASTSIAEARNLLQGDTDQVRMKAEALKDKLACGQK